MHGMSTLILRFEAYLHISYSRLDLSKATPEDLVDLEGICDAATFGRNSEVVLDESYRKARKLDNTKFASLFNPVRSGLIDIIRNGILEGHDDKRPVYAELYNLNVYGLSHQPLSVLISLDKVVQAKARSSKLTKILPEERTCSDLSLLYSPLHTPEGN
jgi:hypothetical protein